MIWNYSLVISNNDKVVLNKAQGFFEQILITREWSDHFGGVYVPSIPNPYLEDTLRDVVTTEGLKLTKINPGFITRQMAEINQGKNNFLFRITSTNPIRPGNLADKWETRAFQLFKQGIPEILELVENDSSSQYRYMAPLITEKSCMNCHPKQNYIEGEIRGGISVSFDSSFYSKGISKQLFSLGVVHLLVLILGIIGYVLYYRMAKKYFVIIHNKNKELEKTNLTKDRLFSIIAHDLSGPFHSLNSLLKLTKDGLMTETDFKKYVPELSQNMDANQQLLNNLLNWSKSQMDSKSIYRKPFYINSLINNNFLFFESQAIAKTISLVFDESEKKISVYADQNMIDLVVRNLLANALKFTHEYGAIQVSITESKYDVIVHIIDDGVGISEDFIKKIFGSDMISKRGTNNEKGTGLGLKLCKDFVMKNNGDIHVKSKKGEGSDFYFSIPKTNRILTQPIEVSSEALERLKK